VSMHRTFAFVSIDAENRFDFCVVAGIGVGIAVGPPNHGLVGGFHVRNAIIGAIGRSRLGHNDLFPVGVRRTVIDGDELGAYRCVVGVLVWNRIIIRLVDTVLLDVGQERNGPVGVVLLPDFDVGRRKCTKRQLVVVQPNADLLEIVEALHAVGGLADF